MSKHTNCTHRYIKKYTPVIVKQGLLISAVIINKGLKSSIDFVQFKYTGVVILHPGIMGVN